MFLTYKKSLKILSKNIILHHQTYFIFLSFEKLKLKIKVKVIKFMRFKSFN